MHAAVVVILKHSEGWRERLAEEQGGNRFQTDPSHTRRSPPLPRSTWPKPPSRHAENSERVGNSLSLLQEGALSSLASLIKKAMLCLISLPLTGLNRQIKCAHMNGVWNNILKHAYMTE